nr:hypothetical protein [Tanacetum cinerariifolium]
MDKDILFLESLLTDDSIPPHPIIPNQTKLPIVETNISLKMGYEHFNTTLLTKDVAESSTKNLIPIPSECMVVSENGSQSTEHINDNSSNPLSDESTDYLSKIKDFLCRILSWFSRYLYPLLDSSLGKSVSMIYIAYS